MDEETNLKCHLPIEYLEINKCGVNGKELSQLLFCLPALSCLKIGNCQGLKSMGVVEQQQHHQVIEEDEGLLLFPLHFSTSLLELKMVDCSDLRVVMVSAGEMAGEGRSRGLQGLRSLLSLTIERCGNLFSAFDFSSPHGDEDMTSHCCPFPSSLQKLHLIDVKRIPSLVLSNLTSLTSLQQLWLKGVEGIPSLALSNLTSLTSLQIPFMGWDEVEQHILIHVNLIKWEVWRGTLIGNMLGVYLNPWELLAKAYLGNVLEAWESEETKKGKGEEMEPPHLLPSSSSHPHPHVLKFWTDDLPGFLMAPSLCIRLSSSLHTLFVNRDKEVEGFTTEQEQALQLLTSLQYLGFQYCKKLRSLPAGLHRLRNLKRLGISGCQELRNGVAELLTQGNLMELRVIKSPNFFSADWEPSRGAAEATAVPNSSRLQELLTDDIAGFLMASSLCSLLSSSLQTLVVYNDRMLEGFTAEQEQALQLLTSLQYLLFSGCSKLRSLPAGLHRLRNLKRLQICYCPEIRSLPKEGLPSSLQQLDVSSVVSNELNRGCRKLRNIPEIIL